MKELNNRVAIVTGCANPRGMGRAIVEVLAEMGADICASDVAQPDLDPVHEALGYRYGAQMGLEGTVAAAQALGVEAIGVAADVTNAEEVEAMVAECARRVGPPDILVNVAGGSWGSNRVTEYAPEDWLKTVKINLYGAFLTTKFALTHMENLGRGSIVNIASVAAIRSHTMVSAYGAAKAGLVQFTRDVATEYGPAGVRANAVLPGDIRTDLYAMEARGMGALLGMSEEEVMELSAGTTPLRRIGEPLDVAGLVGFLCTDRASFLTGLAIPVTGGKELPFKAH